MDVTSLSLPRLLDQELYWFQLRSVSCVQDGEHSLRSVLNWVEGNDREGWYWQADATHDTFINLLNTDTEPARVQISLDYTADGQERIYQLPERTLAPRATLTVDVGEVIAEGQPDHGNVIPPSVNYGGYHVRKVGPGLGATLTTEALVFDHQRKSFLTIYNTCCGLNGPPSFSPGQFLGPIGPIGNFLLQGQDYCSGQTVDLTSGGTYSSANTAIATVGSVGNVKGVSGGSTNSKALLKYYQQRTVDTCVLKSQSREPPTTVQIPTSLSMSLGGKVTYNGNSMIECDGTNDGPRWGYSRCATFTLLDQNGSVITGGNFAASEVVTTVSSNPTGLAANTGGGNLTPSGTFQDFWAFVAKSSPPPRPGQFVKAQQNITITDNAHGKTYSNIRKNCLDFESGDVSVTDITKSGTCQ